MLPRCPSIPDHELVRRIGGGSYGDVWLARTAIGTWRAVKVVFRDRFAEARPYEREFRGIQMFEPLSRSNEAFMDILHIGRDDSLGYFYAVMELADDAGPGTGGTGQSGVACPEQYIPRTLARVLAVRGRLPLPECLELGITLNLGLGQLHKAGLIHRDVKPSNIIFVGGVPKLADIGLVTDMGEARSFVGAEGYIAPEGPNSPQADLYSLGKVLYEAGMGKDRKEFPEPFTLLAEASDADVLLELNAIFLKACAASVEERYQTAEEMNADLAHPSEPRVVFFGRDSTRLISVADDRVARIWRTRDGSLEEFIPLPEADAFWLGVNPDLDTAVALRGNPLSWRVVFREIQTGRLIRECPEVNLEITALAYSPDGNRVAMVADNQCGRIWDARSGEPLTPWFKHGGALSCVEWSPDGTLVLTAGQSPEVKVWNASTGKPALPPLVMKVEAVKGARFSPDGRFIVAKCEEALVRVWDAGTGEAVTPYLPHPDTISDVFITAGNNLVSVQNSGELRSWSLSEWPGSTDDLRDHARLLAGGDIQASGSIAQIPVETAATLEGSLQERRPDWFEREPARLQNWHRSRARSVWNLEDVGTALFHLGQLARMPGLESAVEEDMQRCRQLEIPPRAPDTPPECINLEYAYTTSLSLLWSGQLAPMPRRLVHMAGTPFDLRGMMRLDHRAEHANPKGPFHPIATASLGVRCHRLHFLQASVHGPVAEGTTTGRWIMEYADGTFIEWPILYGDQIRELVWKGREPLQPREAVVAWQSAFASGDAPDQACLRLFKASWENPRPDTAIKRIEMRIAESSVLPIVFAITAE